jgi:hypothetical protein
MSERHPSYINHPIAVITALTSLIGMGVVMDSVLLKILGVTGLSTKVLLIALDFVVALTLAIIMLVSLRAKFSHSNHKK